VSFRRSLPIHGLVLSAFLALGTVPARGADTVHLKDGSTYTGDVVELGSSTIELALSGGSKKILKRDIARVAFDEERRRKEVSGTDLVVRRDGHRLRGKVETLDAGQRVQVTLEDGARAVFQRKDILRIIKSGDVVERDTTVYTKELGDSIQKALAVLKAGDARGKPTKPMQKSAGRAREAAIGPDQAEKLLVECGIFAIQPVREALARAAPTSAEARALRRVDRQYRLRETVDPAIEVAEGRVYDILTAGTAREKCDFLVLVFPRYVDESGPLAALLASDDEEDPTVRAWSVEFLRRMQKNWLLVDVYRRSTGQVQLAAAIALGRNRILVGIPTLIEALEMESVEMREIAGKHLREFTGEDLLFRADGAPRARKEAVLKWRAWWQSNSERLTALAESVLRSEHTDTPERKAAAELWRHAGQSMAAKNLEEAEKLLKEAVRMDPGFYQAQVSLAILYYTDLGRAQDAVKLLEDARARLSARLVPEERQWIHLHLAHALRVCGDIDRAAASYEQTKLLVPTNIRAWLGLVDMKLAQATSGANLKPEERERLLGGALEASATADTLLDQIAKDHTALRFEEIPAGIELPFDRREYNRSVMDLRKRFRLKRQELQFATAKIKCLLGDKKEGMLILRRTIDDIATDPTEGSKKIEAGMRAFLGTLYEEMGSPLLALKEYRKVLQDVDPQHAECAKGLDRLKKIARQAETGN
jgi:tetratricopeptide (TPR) repeat protein